MRILPIFVLLSVLFTGCKTQEEIQREKLVDTMSGQVKQGLTNNAKLIVRLQELENLIQNISGNLEETNHNSNTSNVSLREKVFALEKVNIDILEQQSQQQIKLVKLEEAMEKQNTYIKKVLSSLNKISAPTPKKLSPYDSAMKSYKKGHYKTAKKGLVKLVSSKYLSKKQKARVLHNLGMIEHIHKNNKKSLEYFGKLYANFPNSPYNPNALLFLQDIFKN